MTPGVPCSARKNAHWSETRCACCMLWVTITIVTSLRRARRSSPRPHGSRSGRAPSTARPSAAPAAGPRATGRCTGAAADRPTGRRPGLAEPVLHLVPQPGLAQALLDERVLRRCASLRCRSSFSPASDVVVDRHRRERVRLLEHHARSPAGVGEPPLGVVDVDAVEQDLARPAPRPGSARASG